MSFGCQKFQSIFGLLVDIPEVAVFPKSSVILGIPNTLICQVDNIFPHTVINITWFYNGQFVAEGVSLRPPSTPEVTTPSSSSVTSPLFPPSEDFYDCRVEHWGLEEPRQALGIRAFPKHTPFSTSNPPAFLLNPASGL